MLKPSELKFYKEIDLDTPDYNLFCVYPDDFYFKNYAKKQYDLEELKACGDIFHEKQEVLDLLDRYFEESGGRISWRWFTLVGMKYRQLKVIVILRTDLGFVICNVHNVPLTKKILSAPVDKKALEI